MEAIDFKPEIVSGKYITFLLELSTCVKCDKRMIRKPRDHRDTFPVWHKINFDSQAKKADLVIRSDVTVDNHYICVDCVKAGKSDFCCALCKERKPTSNIQESYGYPPEFLCKDCFGSVTAELWSKKTDQLYEDHKYDFD